MSKYTTEVRYICEVIAGETESKGFSEIDHIIEQSAPSIFGSDFPIFDETYRLPLEKKILAHYYTREIGEETFALWKFRLQTRMNEIMPFYNQMYSSTLYEFDPFNDINISTTHAKTNDNEFNGENTNTGTASSSSHDELNEDVDISDSASTTNNESRTNTNTEQRENDLSSYYSDTPQGDLDGLVALDYVTNATIEKNGEKSTQNSVGGIHGNTSSTGAKNIDTGRTRESSNNAVNQNIETTKQNAKNTEQYVEQVIGKRGYKSYSELVLEFRKTFLNIDMLIIDELSDLFINLW